MVPCVVLTLQGQEAGDPAFRNSDEKPPGAADYVPMPPADAGKHLALTMQKLRNGFAEPDRPFRIWALGSSYTNMLGNGEIWQEEIPKRFPKVKEVHYQKMVGNSCPWQYLRGWVRHLVVPDPPDLVITYTNGDPADLDLLLAEIRKTTTADIIVPSLHWRIRDLPNWGVSEDAADQNVQAVREVCTKHGAEFVESRKGWGRYLRENELKFTDLLKDPVHQNGYGAWIVNQNILSHLRDPGTFSYDPTTRERRIEAKDILVDAEGFDLSSPWMMAEGEGARLKVPFSGNRVELIAETGDGAGRVEVWIDGIPGAKFSAFLPTYIQGDAKNAKNQKGDNPRDLAPHAVTLGAEQTPQEWTILMTSDAGDYELTGSVTGPDGKGNAFQPFTSDSGQISVPPELWRRGERNKAGDRFTFRVERSVVGEVDLSEGEGGLRRIRLANGLADGPHELELVSKGGGTIKIMAVETFDPPGLP